MGEKRHDIAIAIQHLPERKRKRSERAADTIRERIIANRLVPGDRIPSAWVLPAELGVSRGTAREALKVLESQGLIKSKTGPSGGVFVSAVNSDDAIRMLDNLFLFKAPSIDDIYAIRRKLEPELAASVAGKLSDESMAALQRTIRLYEDEPETAEEEYRQRLAELDFHTELASHSENVLLGFMCKFLASLLRDMTVCREIYRKPNPELRETGLHYQIRLLRALHAGKAEAARQIMYEHMVEAEKYMLEMAAIRAPGEY
jgi:GntR family transcriptional regulator, transcriptional repressor for pyruvate dehydrogenase complex